MLTTFREKHTFTPTVNQKQKEREKRMSKKTKKKAGRERKRERMRFPLTYLFSLFFMSFYSFFLPSLALFICKEECRRRGENVYSDSLKMTFEKDHSMNKRGKKGK